MMVEFDNPEVIADKISAKILLNPQMHSKEQIDAAKQYRVERNAKKLKEALENG